MGVGVGVGVGVGAGAGVGVGVGVAREKVFAAIKLVWPTGCGPHRVGLGLGVALGLGLGLGVGLSSALAQSVWPHGPKVGVVLESTLESRALESSRRKSHCDVS